MSKINQIAIPVTVKDGILQAAYDQIDNEHNWKLVRERDGLVRTSKDIVWVEFHDNGTYKDKHDTIAINRSLLMSPFNIFYAWQTTLVTEIVEQKEDYIKFKTQNSTYELSRISKNN